MTTRADRVEGGWFRRMWRWLFRSPDRICEHGKTIDMNGCQECDLFRCPRCELEVS